MRRRYVQIRGELVEVDPHYIPEPAAPTVWGDLPAYESPASGLIVEGRAARREDLKRSGCRPWEGMDAEKAEARRWQQEQDRKADAYLDAAANRALYEIPYRYRKVLENG